MSEVISVQESLSEILPADVFSVDDDQIARVSIDTSDGIPVGRAAAVVYPTTTQQVADLVRFAARESIPIVTQGARTGVVGGATAVDGAILVNLTRMDAILEISVEDQTATCQPGVNTKRLADAVAEKGLFYPPDPGSVSISTIGGNIATNAGGMQCLKYGTTGRFVRELTVVTGAGEIIRVGHKTAKGVASLDLASLFVGSEGTLGIITEATLALRPAPGEVLGAYGVFRTMSEALEAANRVVASPYGPTALEVMDGQIIRAINALNRAEVLPNDAEAILIVQSDATGSAAEDIGHFAEIFTTSGAIRTVTATTAAEVSEIMDLRRQLHPAMRRAYGAVLNEDIAVPRGRLLELFEGIAEIAQELDVPIATGGHVGDGNLHPLIGFDADKPESRALADAAFEKVMALAAELGGTITGEHGVGVIKRPLLDSELSAEVRALQRGIKAVFDPAGILNPGKKL
ncbi:MAG TPA: FAD-binding protein [Pseudoclavibacter sp.]|nr:FAD-binding protein [Pseudoclavibacter sp.]